MSQTRAVTFQRASAEAGTRRKNPFRPRSVSSPTLLEPSGKLWRCAQGPSPFSTFIIPVLKISPSCHRTGLEVTPATTQARRPPVLALEPAGTAPTELGAGAAAPAPRCPGISGKVPEPGAPGLGASGSTVLRWGPGGGTLTFSPVILQWATRGAPSEEREQSHGAAGLLEEGRGLPSMTAKCSFLCSPMIFFYSTEVTPSPSWTLDGRDGRQPTCDVVAGLHRRLRRRAACCSWFFFRSCFSRQNPSPHMCSYFTDMWEVANSKGDKAQVKKKRLGESS